VAVVLALVALVGGCRKAPPPPPPLVGEPVTGPVDAPEAAPVVAGAARQAATLAHEAPPEDNVFVWPEGGAEFLDPNKISESAGSNIAQNMFEGLLAYAPGNAPPVPGVAERYEVSEDGLTWTFHLRGDARWSNGRTVTAHDFVYSWRRALDPATASKNAQQLWFIEGAKELNKGSLTDPEAVGVRAVDDRTLVVRLVGPTPFFPYVISYIAYAPVPREAIEQWGDQWTRPEHIVTNGPFHMTEWKMRDRVVLKKSETYWDKDAVRLSGAVILHNESESTAFQLYESGLAHWLPGLVPTDKIPLLLAAGRPDFHIDPYMCVYYYLFRMDRPPFDSALVRRAINMATDKERIVKHILRAGQTVATHLVPPMFEETTGYVSPTGDPFDPETAARLLAEAGYPEGSGLPRIEFVYNTFEGHRLIAESIQRNLQDTLGIETSLNNMEWKGLLKKLHAGDFRVGRGSWCADYPDPVNFLEVLHSESENNYAGYDNPEYDALLDRIRRTPDQQTRNRLMAEAEAMLNRDMPLLPLYFYTRSYLLKPFVKGFETQFLDNHLLKYLYFERG
jgi:ABC-type oligopeptide transport system substrate-binding subunit